MSQEDVLFSEFLRITNHLNSKLHITPVLYGSLGLQVVSGVQLYPQDIDFLVPLSYLQNEWSVLKNTLEDLGYQLFDLHEHEFHKNGATIAFSYEEDLQDFAGINSKALKLVTYHGCRYRQLSLTDFLSVYLRSAQDGYRRSKNNNKDFQKIELLKILLAGRDNTT